MSDSGYCQWNDDRCPHLRGQDETVDQAGGAVAPLDQSVRAVAQRRRQVAAGHSTGQQKIQRRSDFLVQDLVAQTLPGLQRKVPSKNYNKTPSFVRIGRPN